MNSITAYIRKWLETSTQKQKVIAAMAAVGVLASAVLFSLTNSANVSSDPLSTTPFYYMSAFVKLMVVLLLIVGSSIVARRWFQPGLNGKSARQMQLVETVRLSPKQTLHLVRIGDQQMVIGATDQNISLLASFDGEADSVPVSGLQPQPVSDFGSVLRSIDR